MDNSRHPAASGRRWKQQCEAGRYIPNFLIISVSCRIEYHPGLHEPTVAEAKRALMTGFHVPRVYQPARLY